MAARFEALGWHVQHVKDGNTDLDGLRAALDAAKKDPRPSFIKARPGLACVYPPNACSCPATCTSDPMAAPFYQYI